MAEKTMRYKDLNHSLGFFKGQVVDSLPYALNDCPRFESPKQIFDWLKLRTTYKHDPKGIELFQTLPTLLDKNYHGITGAGDCDCFTIAALSLLIANGFKNCGIVLVGRNSFVPVHIYAYCDHNGKREYLDLTNKTYNYERNYPFKQHIPYNLTQTEKTMLLQLADGGYSEPVYPYIQLSSQGLQVREDYFDTLPASQFQKMLLSEGYGFEEIAELSGRRAERKARKQAAKQEKRTLKREKKQAKTEIKKARAEKKRAAGQAKVTKAQAKQDAANNPEGAEQETDKWFDRASQSADIIGRVVGKVRGGGADSESEDYQSEGATKGAAKPSEGMFSGTTNIFGQEVSKKTLWIGGGLTLLVAGTIAYNQTKKRRRIAA